MSKNKIDLSHKIIIVSVIIICFILVIFTIAINSKKGFGINYYNDNGIKFNYDNTFRLNKNKEYIELINNDNSAVIAIKKMEYSYDLNYDNASSIAYQIISKDGTYNKIYDNYENNKYYFLYEDYDKGRQIEIIEIQKENYLYLLVFEANSSEFDLFQESFDIIIDTFKV